jgi:hypothetical protein
MYPNTTEWMCGACGSWNKIENQICSRCKHTDREHAFTYRTNRALVPEEKIFYTHSVPAIIDELKTFNRLLHKIWRKLNDERQTTDQTGIEESPGD